MPFTPDKQQQILSALEERGVSLPCPRCSTNEWVLIDGFINHIIADFSNQLVLGGRILPTICVICEQCGYLSQHSAIRLGVNFTSEEAAVQDKAVASETSDGPVSGQ